MQDYKKLQVWQKGHQLTLAIYKATRAFPREEMYGLTSQLRRSASSVPANIAEGCGRDTPAELVRFLYVALGSASECEYHLLLAHDLGFLDDKQYRFLSGEATQIKRMLAALIRKLRTDN
jgi:four helix bundle protein